jgi:hypothetical protein
LGETAGWKQKNSIAYALYHSHFTLVFEQMSGGVFEVVEPRALERVYGFNSLGLPKKASHLKDDDVSGSDEEYEESEVTSVLADDGYTDDAAAHQTIPTRVGGGSHALPNPGFKPTPMPNVVEKPIYGKAPMVPGRPAPAAKSQVSSNASAAAPNPNATTQVVSQSRAPMAKAPMPTPVPSQQAGTPEVTLASAHGRTTDRVDAFDVGITHDKSNIYTAFVPLRWSATLDEIRSSRDYCIFELNASHLKQLFKVYVKNPDKALTDGDAYRMEENDLKRVHLKELSVMQVSNNSLIALDVVADTDRLKFLNNVVRSSARSCMFTVLPGAQTYFEKGFNIIDNSDVVHSKTFVNFAHTSVDRFRDDILFPSDHDQDRRPQIVPDSQLARMISKNMSSLRAAFPSVQLGETLEMGDKGYRIPQDVIIHAIKDYKASVNPLLNSIIDATEPLQFEILPAAGSWEDVSSHNSYAAYTRSAITVELQLRIEYCFPKSATGRYSRAAAAQPSVRDQFNASWKAEIGN